MLTTYEKQKGIIVTERLLLRPMQLDDLEGLLAIFTDPVVMASFDDILFDRAQMQAWIDRNLEHQERYGYGLFTVLFKPNGQLIGDCGLENMQVAGEAETELGYDFKSDYWNRGLATEAAAAVRDYAFQNLGLPRLVSLIRQGNRRSQRVAEKIGMRLASEMTRYGHVYFVYSITA